MADPVFFLQIVDRDGHVVRLPAGGQLEVDLVEELVSGAVEHSVADFLGGSAVRRQFFEAASKRIAAKPIGVFRTKAQVLKAVEEGLAETFTGFLAQLAEDVTPTLTQAFQETIRKLKRATRSAV